MPAPRPIALVTGASMGLGAEFARLLASEGYDLVLTARSADKLTALKKEVEGLHGVSATVIVHDLADSRGPIAIYDDVDEALRLANDTEFGLQAGIFTSNIATALKAVRTLDFGGVLVNEVPTWRADQQPYGGLRDSGNTREGPAYSIKEMTEIRMIAING